MAVLAVGVTAETAGDEVDNVGAVQLIERLPMVKERCNRICVVHSDLIYINLNGPDGTVAWRADRPPGWCSSRSPVPQLNPPFG